MPASTPRQGLTRTSVLAALLLVSISALQPVAADDAVDVALSDDEYGDNAQLENDGGSETVVESSDPSGGECGETIEYSRC